MTENEQKIKLINLQLLAIIGFILALIISYFLSYDKKQSLENKPKMFSDKESQNLALFQIILVTIVSILFLYITYKQYTISKRFHDEDEEDLFIQTETSMLSVVIAIVGLYIVIKNYKNKNLSISEIEVI